MLSAALRSPGNSVCPKAGPIDRSTLESGKVLAEYIWLGSGGTDLRSRTVVLEQAPAGLEALPVAEIDGSSCGQAMDENCEVYLKPRKIFPDPMRGGPHVLVLCDTFVPPLFDFNEVMSGGSAAEMQPHPSNTRVACEQVMSQAAGHAPVFSVQQEYQCQLDPLGGLPASFGPYGFGPSKGALGGSFGSKGMGGAAGMQGLGAAGCYGSPPYGSGGSAGCNNGLGLHAGGMGGTAAPASLARGLAESHMHACLGAGIQYAGMQQLSEPGAWVFKIGPCAGIDLGDQLTASRHLLMRASECSGLSIAFMRHSGDVGLFGGGGCSFEFSTDASRDPAKGMAALNQHILRLQAHHEQHMGAYSAGSRSHHSHHHHSHHHHSHHHQQHHGSGRTGSHHHHHHHSSATAASCPFSVSIGTKRAAIMIPSSTLLHKCGPIIDTRPPASCDPYTATMLMASSALDVPLPPGCPSLIAHPSSSFTTYSCGARSRDHHDYASSVTGDSCGSLENSEDVLISELDRRDGFSPCSGGLSFVSGEGFSGYDDGAGFMGDTASDGESPLRDAPLSAAVNDDMAF